MKMAGRDGAVIPVQRDLTHRSLLKSSVIERSSSCLRLSKWNTTWKDPAPQ